MNSSHSIKYNDDNINSEEFIAVSIRTVFNYLIFLFTSPPFLSVRSSRTLRSSRPPQFESSPNFLGQHGTTRSRTEKCRNACFRLSHGGRRFLGGATVAKGLPWCVPQAAPPRTADLGSENRKLYKEADATCIRANF